MQKWEYTTFNRQGGSWTEDRFDGRLPAEKLSDFGNEGWELVSVCYDGSGYHYYLKRPVETASAAPKKSKAKSKANDAPQQGTESMENSI